jgi:rod shape determining protein RodA
MADYQKARILTFLDPGKDPYGAGYNSIQAMITVGAGKFLGRGLGKGVQTQLSFLPERHTDFIFASIAEEMGFFGTFLLLVGLLFLFWRLSGIITDARSPSARAFVAGVFLTLFVQTFVHIGMNMGLLPITGVPLPLVSAGGSSLLGTSLAFALALTCRKEKFS